MQGLLFWASARSADDCCYLPRYRQDCSAIACPPVSPGRAAGVPGCAVSAQVTKTASTSAGLTFTAASQ